MNERERQDHTVEEEADEAAASVQDGAEGSPLETLEKAVGLINKVLHKQVRLATESRDESRNAAAGYRELKRAVRPVVETLKAYDLHPRRLPGVLTEWERLKQDEISRDRIARLLEGVAELLTTQAKLAGDFEGMAGRIRSLKAKLREREEIIEQLRAESARSEDPDEVENQEESSAVGDREPADESPESYREALQTMIELENQCGHLLDGNMELMERLRAAQRERLRAEAELEAIKAAQSIRKAKT